MEDEIKKTAIILDTNFIIEHKNELREILEKLSEDYDVYVTEISINERISQKYLLLKSKYEKIESTKKEYKPYATIKSRKPFETKYEEEKKYTNDGYKEQFNEKIIPFNPNQVTLTDIMDRVFKKTPPFSNAEKASDKGFKDTLLWISLMDFFTEKKEDINIIFISNDKGFLKYKEALQTEFLTTTGKNIVFNDNSFYAQLLGETTGFVKIEEKYKKELSDSEKMELRERISMALYNICTTKNDRGEDVIAFFTETYFENENVQIAFEDMHNTLADHILETHIRPSIMWGSNFVIIKEDPIPIKDAEAILELYQTIKIKYNEYMTPFLNAVCEKINEYYRKAIEYDPDNMPF